MCLELIKDWEKLTAEYKAQKEPIEVWKILTKSGYSCYQAFRWFNGLNKSDRTGPDLDKWEIRWGEVKWGFHFYLSKDTVEREVKAYKKHMVVKAIVKPEDVVAVGYFDGHLSLVATQCVAELPTESPIESPVK